CWCSSRRIGWFACRLCVAARARRKRRCDGFHTVHIRPTSGSGWRWSAVGYAVVDQACQSPNTLARTRCLACRRGGPTEAARRRDSPDSGTNAQCGCCHAAERVVTRFERGRPIRSWQPKRDGERNEALDTFVYAHAALHGLISMGLRLNEEADEMASVPASASGRTTRVIRSRWVQS